MTTPSSTAMQLSEQNATETVTLVRPGALGDVLVLSPVLARIHDAYPSAKLRVLAPGSRGQLLKRLQNTGQTLQRQITVFDLDSADASFLYRNHTETVSAPPRLLSFFEKGQQTHPANVTRDCRHIAIAYLSDPEHTVQTSLRALGCTQTLLHPARPENEIPIAEHLLAPLYAAGILTPSPAINMKITLSSAAPARLYFTPEEKAAVRQHCRFEYARFIVIHPGSGSQQKNWPHYNQLLSLLQQPIQNTARENNRLHIVLTSAEADGDLGFLLHEQFPQTIHLHEPSLTELGALLSQADGYLGNDSGVTHLAHACGNPRIVSLFGTSSPRIWASPGATILHAPAMDQISPQTVLAALHQCGLI